MIVVSPKQAEKFKCDQCDYSNPTEKGVTQHKRMKHCPTLKLKCLRQEHVDLCCDVVEARCKGQKVKAPPQVYHPNIKMYGVYNEERSDCKSSFYGFHLPCLADRKG